MTARWYDKAWEDGDTNAKAPFPPLAMTDRGYDKAWEGGDTNAKAPFPHLAMTDRGYDMAGGVWRHKCQGTSPPGYDCAGL